MIIYLDMDDVVADWHRAAQDFLGMRWEKDGRPIPREDWNRVKQNSRFYRNLPLKPGAVELVQYCRGAVAAGRADDLFFLTALPNDCSVPYAASDKVWWAHEHFPDITVFLGPFSHDKQRHCRPGDILIDDRTSNCEEWIQAGGHAHIYRTWEACQPWLEQTISAAGR
jgi:hypothetical protein